MSYYKIILTCLASHTSHLYHVAHKKYFSAFKDESLLLESEFVEKFYFEM